MKQIPKSTFTFLKDLKNNNHKIWFDANKEKYLSAKENLVEWTSELLEKISKIEMLPPSEAKKHINRIYRDVRFSKDKTPYHTHFAVSVMRSADMNSKCGVYIHLQPGGSFFAGGVYMPSPEQLKLIRDGIDYDANPLHKILNSKSFKDNFGGLHGERLVRPPKDFPADHEEIELLKMKQFLISKPFSDKEVLSDSFQNEIVKTYRESLKLFAYFDQALGFAE